MNEKQYFSKIIGLFSFPSLLSCITLTMLFDTCLFAPLAQVQLGPISINQDHVLIAKAPENIAGNYFLNYLGTFKFEHERLLFSSIIIAKLYSTQIIDQCEITGELEALNVNKVTISQDISPSARISFFDLFDPKLPQDLANKFEQFSKLSLRSSVSASFVNLYSAQKIIRVIIMCLSLLSFAAKTIAGGPFSHILIITIDVTLALFSVALIVTLSISHHESPIRYFPSLVCLLIFCSLSLMFDIIENWMAKKFENHINASQGCMFSKSLHITSTRSSQAIEFPSPFEDQHGIPSDYENHMCDEHSIELDLDAPIISSTNCEKRNEGFSFSNPRLVTALDFEAILPKPEHSEPYFDSKRSE